MINEENDNNLARKKRQRLKPAKSIHDRDYQFALLFQESAKKIEIVKQVQSIVINSERLVCPQGRTGGANGDWSGGRRDKGILKGGGRGMGVRGRLSKRRWMGERKEREMRGVTVVLSNQGILFIHFL